MTTTAIAEGLPGVPVASSARRSTTPRIPAPTSPPCWCRWSPRSSTSWRPIARTWRAVEGATDVPLFGFPHGVGLEPVSVNVARMVGIFRRASATSGRSGGGPSTPTPSRDVTDLAETGDRAFRFPDPLWVRVVYDFALAYRPARPAPRAAPAVAGAALPGAHRLLRAPERRRAARKTWRRRSDRWPTSSCGRSRTCASAGIERETQMRRSEPC